MKDNALVFGELRKVVGHAMIPTESTEPEDKHLSRRGVSTVKAQLQESADVIVGRYDSQGVRGERGIDYRVLGGMVQGRPSA